MNLVCDITNCRYTEHDELIGLVAWIENGQAVIGQKRIGALSIQGVIPSPTPYEMDVAATDLIIDQTLSDHAAQILSFLSADLAQKYQAVSLSHYRDLRNERPVSIIKLVSKPRRKIMGM